MRIDERAVARRTVAMAIVVAAALAPQAWAGDVVERARAERLAAAGRCDEALQALTTIATAEPGDARLIQQVGECQLRKEKYEDAVISLRRARMLDPTLHDADMSLAIASFHTGDFEGTLEAVTSARGAGSQRPELALYEGLALYGLGRDDSAAARSLESVAGVGGAARGIDPVANYYAGMAWQRAGDRDRARAALQEVIDENPGTSWAQAAQRALDGGSASGTQAKRMWARVTSGIEWDSNAVFRGEGVTLPDDISNEDDFLGVLAAELAGEVVQSGPWTVGVRADYLGTVHFDLTDFDLQYPGVGAWVDYRLSAANLLRLDYAFHYGWLGYDAYVTSNYLSPQWFHQFEAYGLFRAYGLLTYDVFHDDSGDEIAGPGVVGAPCVGTTRCGPPNINEAEARDRDGYGGGVGFDHTLPVEWLRGSVWGGLFWEFYQSDGSEYQFNGYGLRTGFRSEFAPKWALAGWAGFIHRPFHHASTYPDPNNPQLLAGQEYALSSDNRLDEVIDVELELAREITDSLSVSLRYAYTWNNSNVAVFDYDRSVVGAYLTWAWDR